MMTSLTRDDLAGQRGTRQDTSLFGRVLEYFERRRVYQTLAAMDDRLLDDLGVSRGDLRSKVFGPEQPSLFARMRQNYRQARQYRATVRELERLSPAALADIGVEPGLIPEYARSCLGTGAWTHEPVSPAKTVGLGQRLTQLAEATAAPFTLPRGERVNPGRMARVDGKHLEDIGYVTAEAGTLDDRQQAAANRDSSKAAA